MFRKVLSLALAATLLAFMLLATGCAAWFRPAEEPAAEEPVEEPTDEPIEEPAEEPALVPEEGASLTIWDTDDPSGHWFRDAAIEWGEKHGVEIIYEPVAFGATVDQLKIDGPAGLGADVFAAPHDRVGDLVAAGLILPNDVSNPANFMESTITGLTMDGVLWGFPTAIETYALFYNKDLLPEPPETWDELLDFAVDFNDISANRFAFMMLPADFYFVHGFFGGFGGYVFGDGGTNPDDIGLNNEGSVEAARFMQRLQDIMPLNTADVTYDIMVGLFNDGYLATMINGPWAVAGVREAGVNFGVAPLPILPNDENPKSFAGVRGLFINSFTEYPNAAKLLLEYITSQEVLIRVFTQGGMLPARLDLVEDPAVIAEPITQAFIQQATFAVPMPSIPEMGSVWIPMSTALTQIWNEDVDPKPVLDAAVEEIKAAIEIAR